MTLIAHAVKHRGRAADAARRIGRAAVGPEAIDGAANERSARAELLHIVRVHVVAPADEPDQGRLARVRVDRGDERLRRLLRRIDPARPARPDPRLHRGAQVDREDERERETRLLEARTAVHHPRARRAVEPAREHVADVRLDVRPDRTGAAVDVEGDGDVVALKVRITSVREHVEARVALAPRRAEGAPSPRHRRRSTEDLWSARVAAIAAEFAALWSRSRLDTSQLWSMSRPTAPTTMTVTAAAAIAVAPARVSTRKRRSRAGHTVEGREGDAAPRTLRGRSARRRMGSGDGGRVGEGQCGGPSRSGHQRAHARAVS